MQLYKLYNPDQCSQLQNQIYYYFYLGRCLAALGVALSGIGGIMSADGDFGAAIIFFVFAILYSLTGLGLMRYWKENRGSVERKLHRRFPQLRFSKMLPANGGGWQVEKRTAEVPGQFVGTLEFV